MADQVTVSTFLELKDNMSKGLQRLESLLQRVTAAAAGAQVALDSFNKSASKLAGGFKAQGAAQAAVIKQQQTAQAANARAVRKQQIQDAKATEFAAKLERNRRKELEASTAKVLRQAEKELAQKEKVARRGADTDSREAARAANAKMRESQRAARMAERSAARDRRIREREQKESRRHTSLIASSLFGPGIGSAIAAFGTPEAGPLAAIAGVELLFSAIKKAVSTTADLIGEFSSKVFEVGKQYQDTTLRIGMSLQSLGVAPSFANARFQADALYTTMRKLARDLPGETKDYMEVFSLALPMALHAGEKDLKHYATMVSKYTAFAFTRGVTDTGQIGRDLERMAQGRVLSTTRLFKELQPFIKGMPAALSDAVKEFNKIKDPAKQLKMVYEAIDQATTGLGASTDTASAKVGTLYDLIDQIFQYAGKPLFESQIAVLDKINKYLIDNNSKITSLVRTISTYLGNALEGAAAKILEWADNFEVVKSQLRGLLTIFDTIAALSPILGPWGAAAGAAYFAARAAVSFGVDTVGEMQSAGAQIRQRREEEQRTKVREKTAAVLEKYKAVSGPAPGAPVAEQKKWAQGLFKTMAPEEAETLIKGRLGVIPSVIAEWFTEAGAGKPDVSLKSTPTGRSQNNYDFRFSRFDIKQQFAEGFDPDRIAVAFASDLARLGEFKMMAQTTPSPVGAQ